MSDFVVENRMWNPEAEATSRAELKQLQTQRLRQSIERASAINFYKERFKQCGLNSGSIRSLEDLRRLPFTTKQDLRDNYPFGFFALPKSKLARIHASSGTTGKPTFVC